MLAYSRGTRMPRGGDRAVARRRGEVAMRTGSLAFLSLLLVAFALLPQQAGAQPAVSLAGRVSSAEEGAMEGVVVSARREGAGITISVVSDEKGAFAFPADKLVPGRYALGIRAVGYDLKGPVAAEIAPGKPASVDLALVKTRNLPGQLTNAEWMASVPGTDEQKKFLLNCNSCHSFERIVKSTHDPEEFMAVITRMGGYYPGATPIHPQRLVGRQRDMARSPNMKATTEWLASINLSQATRWEYELKTFPRLTGRSTRVIYTEYDLPRSTIEPHDVILDAQGMVWFSNFGELALGKMDPKTGKVTEYPIPELKKGFPTGMLDLEIG